MDNASYVQEMRETVDQFVKPRNPDAAELLYDALTQARPAADMLTVFESVGMVCLDEIHASSYRNQQIEFIFMWRIDRSTAVSCELRFQVPHSPKTEITLGGYAATDTPENEDEWWRIGHAKAAAGDAETQYRIHKKVVGMLYPSVPEAAKIIEEDADE